MRLGLEHLLSLDLHGMIHETLPKGERIAPPARCKALAGTVRLAWNR
jgi:hypothetical protein